jgi:hypothetical protein
VRINKIKARASVLSEKALAFLFVLYSLPLILPGNDKAVVVGNFYRKNGISRISEIARLPMVKHKEDFSIRLKDVA